MNNDDPTPAPTTDGNANGNGKKKLGPVHYAVLAVVLIATAFWGYGKWRFMTTHAGTDNAYLTANITQIAPQVAGSVVKVCVTENQRVDAGDLLVLIDDAKYKAAVQQAKANLASAVADAKAAGVNVDLTRLTGSAQELQAEGVVAQSVGGLRGAEADAQRAAAAVRAALASQHAAQADASSAQTDVALAKVASERASLAVQSAQAQLDGARAGLSAAKSAKDAADAKLDYASKEAERMRSLVDSGAVSRQRYDDADANLKTARAQAQAAQDQVEAAKAALNRQQIELESALKTVDAARSVVIQARNRADSAVGKRSAAKAQADVAVAQADAAKEAIVSAAGRKTQAVGQQKQAATTARQVAAREAMRGQTLAKIEQAKAALAAAELDLQRTRITAPISGIVSKKTVQPGALVQVGTPLMAVVADSGLYVVANFKETQIDGMRAGMPVTVNVDGFGEHSFSAKVDSVSAATGATFALLPADNATGNFVKVVQRVPVKIVLDSGQKDLEMLRAGMSVDVAVKLR